MQKFSNVPDLHGVVVCKNEHTGEAFVIVVGAGMQIFRVDTQPKC
jgi:hypothetical protein